MCVWGMQVLSSGAACTPKCTPNSNTHTHTYRDPLVVFASAPAEARETERATFFSRSLPFIARVSGECSGEVLKDLDFSKCNRFKNQAQGAKGGWGPEAKSCSGEIYPMEGDQGAWDSEFQPEPSNPRHQTQAQLLTGSVTQGQSAGDLGLTKTKFNQRDSHGSSEMRGKGLKKREGVGNAPAHEDSWGMERRPSNPKNIYLKLSGLSRYSYSSSPFPPFKCPTLYISVPSKCQSFSWVLAPETLRIQASGHFLNTGGSQPTAQGSHAPRWSMPQP